MFERIRHMLVKEFILILRDPKMKGIVFIMPIIQVLLFGYAVTTDVQHVSLGIFDLDNSIASRALTAAFVETPYFDAAAYAGNEEEARELIDAGKVKAVLRFNHGFEGDLRSSRQAKVQLIVDGSDSNTAGIVVSYATQIVSAFSEEVLIERLQRVAGGELKDAQLVVESRAWFNDNLESRNFYVPGVIAMLIMLATLTLTSMAIVREKEVGTIEQIMVTPISSTEFILGKTVPFAIIGYIDVTLVTLVGVFWFDVPIRGSLLLLFGATGLYLMSCLGIGLVISTISSTQQQALMGSFFFYLPSVLLSGFMFPIRNMPEPVQWLTYLNPLRYFLVVVRGIFLKGVGVAILWPQLLALALLGVAVLAFASSRFKKTLA